MVDKNVSKVDYWRITKKKVVLTKWAFGFASSLSNVKGLSSAGSRLCSGHERLFDILGGAKQEIHCVLAS